MSARLEFEIDPKVLDCLVKIQGKLPDHAERANVEGGQGHSYENPAGLALLGMKDDLVDTVVGLRMSGGCWDAPNINFEDMDIGLRALIDKDRICAGMALVRHPDWNQNVHALDEGKMPSQLKNQLHQMRNSFADITKTAWIILHNDYFRVYRPTVGEGGRVGCREIPIKTLFGTEDTSKEKLLDNRIKEEEEKKKIKVEERNRKLAQRKEYEERRLREENAHREAHRLAEIARVEKEKKAALAAEKKELNKAKKLALINEKLKEGKEAIIDSGMPGLVYMKGKDGKYILWATR